MSNKNKQLHKATGRGGNKTSLAADAANITQANQAQAMATNAAALPGGQGRPMAQAQAYASAWGNGALFSPGQPQRPIYEMEEGTRVFDYQAGVNLYITPRSGYGLMPFTMLRNFADYCEEVRIVIEAFKREIRSMEWAIQKLDNKDKTDYSPEQKRLTQFWSHPDGATEFDAWLNACLEDVLVLDALTLWLEPGPGGSIGAVQQIDGATIRPLLDMRGRVPLAPTPGYMQAIKGQNWTWFTSDFLMYTPFNAGINSPYGRSPTEYIITTINTSLQRKLSAMQYWNQTNVPEALVGLPDEWNVENIQQFQDYFDALLVGNTDVLRRIKFMPVKGGQMPVHEFRRPESGTVMDEWVLKMASWAFGFLPSEFGIVGGAGLGGKGFLDGQENVMYRFGVGPIIQYIQNVITTIIQRQTAAPLGFRFVNIGPTEDKKAQAELDEIHLRNGIIDLNVLREKAGQKPWPNVKPFFLVGNTPILLDDLFTPPEPPAPVYITSPAAATSIGRPTDDGDYINTSDEPAADDADPVDDVIDGQVIKMALGQWKLKAQRRVSDGRPALCDPPTMTKGVLSADLVSAVKTLLQQTGPSAIDQGFNLWQVGRQMARAQLLKKKPVTSNQHPTATRNKLERDMAAALARVFAKLGKAPALKVDSVAQAKDLAGGGKFWAEFRQAVADELTPLLERGVSIGLDEAQNDPLFTVKKMAKAKPAPKPKAKLGINWDLVSTDARDWAAKYAGQLVDKIETVTKDKIRAAVAGFIDTSQDIPDLARTIGQLINDPKRAQMIAQTESTRSFAEGNTRAWKAQGVQGRKWFNVEDQKVCPICQSLGGQVAAIGDPFKDDDGNEYDNPPGHPGCRCYVQPVEVVGDDEE